MEFKKNENNSKSLLSIMKKNNWPTININFPGTEHNITLRLLSCQDEFEVGTATDELFSEAKRNVDARNVDDYEKEKEIQRLYRICRDPSTNGPISNTITEFRSQITPFEKESLIRKFNDFASKHMPNELIDNEKINNLKNLLISGSNNEALLSDITNLAEAKALLINLVSTKKANGEN